MPRSLIFVASLVEELEAAGMAVVAADLAVWLVNAGGVREGRRDGVIVRGGKRVPGRGEERLGVGVRDRKRRGAVIQVGGRRMSPGAQGLSF